MNYLSAENVSKSYGEKVLFSNISFGLSKGEKVALVANNGAGKSTLLRILCDKDSGDTGAVSLRTGLRISLLQQAPTYDAGFTVNEIIKNLNTGLVEIISDYEDAIKYHADNNSNESQRVLEHATSQMDVTNAWDYERRLKMLLERFNIVDLEQYVETMSGGQLKRLSLALTLLDNPDILFLDEPTRDI